MAISLSAIVLRYERESSTATEPLSENACEFPFLSLVYPVVADAEFPKSAEETCIEIPHPRGPFGAKGMSEPPMVAPMGAISNAILDACGAHVQTIPINLERLYNVLHPEDKPA